MQFKSQNAAQFAFWNKNLRICLGHKVPISQKKSENCGRFCQKITNYISISSKELNLQRIPQKYFFQITAVGQQYRDLANSELLSNRISENRFRLGGIQCCQLSVFLVQNFYSKISQFYLTTWIHLKNISLVAIVGNTELSTTFS